MKKIIFAIAIVMTMALGASAQRGSDNFFSNSNNYRGENDPYNDILLPGSHNLENNPNASPLGTGLLILTALGAGYAVAKKRK